MCVCVCVRRGDTALHKAASEKQHAVCRLLVEAGASLEKTNFHVNTLTHITLWCRHTHTFPVSPAESYQSSSMTHKWSTDTSCSLWSAALFKSFIQDMSRQAHSGMLTALEGDSLFVLGSPAVKIPHWKKCGNRNHRMHVYVINHKINKQQQPLSFELFLFNSLY